MRSACSPGFNYPREPLGFRLGMIPSAKVRVGRDNNSGAWSNSGKPVMVVERSLDGRFIALSKRIKQLRNR
jgi:hypothetical protein